MYNALRAALRPSRTDHNPLLSTLDEPNESENANWEDFDSITEEDDQSMSGETQMVFLPTGAQERPSILMKTERTFSTSGTMKI